MAIRDGIRQSTREAVNHPADVAEWTQRIANGTRPELCEPHADANGNGTCRDAAHISQTCIDSLSLFYKMAHEQHLMTIRVPEFRRLLRFALAPSPPCSDEPVS